MADTYEINDPSEEEISLEEQAKNIPEDDSSGDRPEWLPEKFKSPEDLANAYNNLESKLGSGEAPSETEDLPPTEAGNESQSGEGQKAAIEAASAEWQESGELSDMTYSALAEEGLSRELVDSFIEGQKAAK